jgi:hypothetical protein
MVLCVKTPYWIPAVLTVLSKGTINCVCVIKRYALKTYGISEIIWRLQNLGIRSTWVVSFTPRPPYFRGIFLLCIEYTSNWTPSRSWFWLGWVISAVIIIGADVTQYSLRFRWSGENCVTPLRRALDWDFPVVDSLDYQHADGSTPAVRCSKLINVNIFTYAPE